MIEEFIKHIPQELWNASGKAFHSGRLAFSGQRDLYVLGFNPGGDPDRYKEETVKDNAEKVLHCVPERWSAFLDEEWPTSRMQNMMRHLFDCIGFDLREVPASDLIFTRSRNAKDISNTERGDLVELCWRFHKAVIDELGVQIILCLGKDAASYIKEKTGAFRQVDEIIYQTAGGKYKHLCFVGWNGLKVVQVLHPSQFSWTHPPSDPTGLVMRALSG